jgi:chromosome segregation ATPase
VAVTKFKDIASAVEAVDAQLKELAKTLKTIDKSVEGKPNIDKLTQANTELNTVNTSLIKTEKQLTGIRKKASTLNKRSEKEADRITQSLDLELQTKKELLKLDQKITRDKAKQLALDKRLGKAQKGSIEDLKRQQKELTLLRNRVKQGTTAYKKYTERLRTVNTELRKTGEEVKDNRANVGNYNGALQKGVQGLKNYAKGLLGVAAAFAAIRKLINTAKEYIDLAREQILQEQKLSTILKERTNATDEQVQSIIELTQAQQALGVVGDEVQIAGAQQFSTFVKNTDSVKQLIPALNNLLVQQKGVNATTQDAVNIANLAGRAFQGQLGSLTRVGISFDEAQGKILKYGTESEKAAALAEIITQNVGELNQELAKTDIGRIQQLNNEIGDIKEEIGKELIPVVVSFKSISTTGFRELRDNINDILEPIKLFRDLFKEAKEEIAAISGDDSLDRLKKIGEFIKEWGNALKVPLKLLGIFTRQLRSALRDLGLLNIRQRKFAQEIRNITQEFNTLDKDIKAKIVPDIKRLQEEFAKDKDIIKYVQGLSAVLVKARELSAQIDKTAGDVGELTEEFIDGADAAGAIVSDLFLEGFLQPDSLIGDPKLLTDVIVNTIEKAVIDSTTTLQKISRRFRFALFGKEGSFLGRLFGGGEDGEAIAAAVIQTYENIVSLIGRATQQELNRIDELLRRQDEAIKKTESQLEAEKDRLNELKSAGAAFDTSEQRRLQAKLRREEEARQKSLEAEKKAKQKQKRLTLAEAIINTASASLKAFESAKNPIIGAILAAIAAAFGAVQIATISGQKFAEGGWVKGPTHKKGGVKAELEGDEFVVKKRFAPKSKRLLHMINSGFLSDENYRSKHYDMSETNSYLKSIDNKVGQNIGYKPDGRLDWKILGNSTLYYN